MAERNYWVLCDDGCKFPAMTAEQVLAAIAEATGSTVTDIDSAFITKIKDMNAGENLKFWVGTTAQFNALATTEENTLYILSDDDTADSIEESIKALQDDLTAYKESIATGAIIVEMAEWAEEAGRAEKADADGDGNTITETYLRKKNAPYIMKRTGIDEALLIGFENKIRVGSNVFVDGTGVWSVNDIVSVSFSLSDGKIFNGTKVSEAETDDNGTFVKFSCSLVPSQSAISDDTRFYNVGTAVVKIYEVNANFYISLDDFYGVGLNLSSGVWVVGDITNWFNESNTLNNAYLFFE